MSENYFDEEFDESESSYDASEEYSNAKKNKQENSGKSRKSKKFGFTKPEDSSESVITERNLYILTDKYTPGLADYFADCGLQVCGIFTDIQQVKTMLLMQFDPCRIAVVDTGTGFFVTPTIRKDLIDMIGVNDENNKFSVFYTDSVLKFDSMQELGKAGKSIDWIPYKGTSVMVATLLSIGEKFTGSLRSKAQAKSAEEILNFKGSSPVGVELEKMQPLMFNSGNIYNGVVDNQDESLRGFPVKIHFRRRW